VGLSISTRALVDRRTSSSPSKPSELKQEVRGPCLATWWPNLWLRFDPKQFN